MYYIYRNKKIVTRHYTIKGALRTIWGLKKTFERTGAGEFPYRIMDDDGNTVIWAIKTKNMYAYNQKGEIIETIKR